MTGPIRFDTRRGRSGRTPAWWRYRQYLSLGSSDWVSGSGTSRNSIQRGFTGHTWPRLESKDTRYRCSYYSTHYFQICITVQIVWAVLLPCLLAEAKCSGQLKLQTPKLEARSMYIIHRTAVPNCTFSFPQYIPNHWFGQSAAAVERIVFTPAAQYTPTPDSRMCCAALQAAGMMQLCFWWLALLLFLTLTLWPRTPFLVMFCAKSHRRKSHRNHTRISVNH